MSDNNEALIKTINESEPVEIPVEPKAKKPYTLRPLRDEDLYQVLAIIGKVFPNDLQAAFVTIASGEKSVKEIGYDVGYKLVVAVIKNLHTVGDDVYALLSDLSGIEPEFIRKMPFGTTPKMIWEIYNEVKNLDFFGDASKLS